MLGSFRIASLRTRTTHKLMGQYFSSQDTQGLGPVDRSLSGHQVSQLSHVSWRRQKSRVEGVKKSSSHLKIVTFNMLAPCYKRLSTRTEGGRRKREGSDPTMWKERAKKTLGFLEKEVFDKSRRVENSSSANGAGIVALQEFWLGGDPLYKDIFAPCFKKYNYEMRAIKRYGEKTDGVVFLINSEQLVIKGSKEVRLVTGGDRVALLMWLEHRATGQTVVVANTHLSFPHNSFDRMLQMRQTQSLIVEVNSFRKSMGIKKATNIIMGDFNAESDSPVCEALREAGYLSSFQVAPPLNQTSVSRDGDDAMQSRDSIADNAWVKWVSHCNHQQEEVGVDHIFLREDAVNVVDTVDNKTNDHSDSTQTRGVYVDECTVLPGEMPCGNWDQDFLVSDHRPVLATLMLTAY